MTGNDVIATHTVLPPPQCVCVCLVPRPLSVPVAPGHYGHILNTWERSRGVYAVTMAMLDLLLGLYEDSVAMDTEGILACVVWVCREVMSTCQGWRHTSRGSRDELGMCVLPPPHCARVYSRPPPTVHVYSRPPHCVNVCTPPPPTAHQLLVLCHTILKTPTR